MRASPSANRFKRVVIDAYACMDGTVAFAIMLTSYGNAHLRAIGETDSLDIPSDRATLKFIRDVEFSCPQRGFLRQKSNHVAGSIGDWFGHILKKGGERLSLVFSEGLDQEQREAWSPLGPRFVGIQVDYPASHELWVPNWDTNARPKGPRIWDISINGAEIANSMAQRTGDLTSARSGIRTALQDGIAFLQKTGVGDWFSEQFAEGLSALDSDSPMPPFYADMLPSRGYGLLARQVITGACYGWVFGGMGSWNDFWFSDDSLIPEYERVTERLLQSVKLGLSEGVNSFSL